MSGLRDATRGGMASALNEIASAGNKQIVIEAAAIPVRDDVHAACEMLGLDPLYMACEGRFLAFVDPADGQKSVEILKASGWPEACVIGHVSKETSPQVVMNNRIGASRRIDLLSGEQLPRIC